MTLILEPFTTAFRFQNPSEFGTALPSLLLFLRGSVDQTLRSIEDEQVPNLINLLLDCSLALLHRHTILEPGCALDPLAEQGTSLVLDVFVPDCCQPLCPESHTLKSLPTSPGKADSPSSVFQSGFWG